MYTTPRSLIYVDVPVVAVERVAFVVKDEADLKAQLAEREASFRAQPFTTKPQRVKGADGKEVLSFHQLSPDWNV